MPFGKKATKRTTFACIAVSEVAAAPVFELFCSLQGIWADRYSINKVLTTAGGR